jgi:hypothetical protein
LFNCKPFCIYLRIDNPILFKFLSLGIKASQRQVSYVNTCGTQWGDSTPILRSKAGVDAEAVL